VVNGITREGIHSGTTYSYHAPLKVRLKTKETEFINGDVTGNDQCQ